MARAGKKRHRQSRIEDQSEPRKQGIQASFPTGHPMLRREGRGRASPDSYGKGHGWKLELFPGGAIRFSDSELVLF